MLRKQLSLQIKAFYYKVMLLGLKNAEAIYQRLVNKAFNDQLGKNVEAYVDEMLVKNKSISHHLIDLKEIFNTLRKYNMNLSLAKYAFGVTSGKFLGEICLRSLWCPREGSR